MDALKAWNVVIVAAEERAQQLADSYDKTDDDAEFELELWEALELVTGQHITG